MAYLNLGIWFAKSKCFRKRKKLFIELGLELGLGGLAGVKAFLLGRKGSYTSSTLGLTYIKRNN